MFKVMKLFYMLLFGYEIAMPAMAFLGYQERTAHVKMWYFNAPMIILLSVWMVFLIIYISVFTKLCVQMKAGQHYQWELNKKSIVTYFISLILIMFFGLFNLPLEQINQSLWFDMFYIKNFSDKQSLH
jgi:hypothetical protein